MNDQDEQAMKIINYPIILDALIAILGDKKIITKQELLDMVKRMWENESRN
jgi:hypothetical protein